MFDPMQFQFSPQAEPFVQNPYGPMPQQYMAGTLSPTQQSEKQEQNALVEALRAMGNQQQQAAPVQAGRVTSAGALGDGMDTGAIGGALGGMF